MAVMSPVPVINLPVDPTGYLDVRAPELMASRREIVEDPVAEEDESKIYVFVGIDVKENLSNLQWVLDSFDGKIIVVMLVYVPSQLIPVAPMGAKLPASSTADWKVRAYRETEEQNMKQILNEYLTFCRRSRAETDFCKANCIEKGILELISKHNIRKLVMGAAADKHYSKNMREPKSRKAIYVKDNAPALCNIWFVCKGNLVYTREGSEGADIDAEVSSLPTSPDIDGGPRGQLNGHKNEVTITSPARGLFHRIRDKRRKMKEHTSPGDSPRLSTQKSKSVTERVSNWLTRKSPSRSSNCSSCSSDGVVNLPSVPTATTVQGENGLHLTTPPHFKEDLCQSSPSSVLDGNLDDTLDHQLQQPVVAAENTRHDEALREAVMQKKREEVVIGAITMANALEILYNEELKRRKEVEEALAKEKDECEKMRTQRDGAMEELKIARDHKSLLESRIAEYDQMVKEFEQKINYVVELLTGEWSLLQADLLVNLALKCREINQRSRTNLGSEARRTHEQLRVPCGGSSSSQLGSEERAQPPTHFLCPISLQIMQDPQIASDGFTYEGSSIKKWLNEGHDTSPSTNRKLPNCTLIPNRSLRSAIQEWQQNN